MMARLARVVLAVPLVSGLGVAASSPQPGLATLLAAAIIAIATLWRPGAGLLVVAALAPAGQLFARTPVLAAELFAWAFLAAWLLAIWRPLARPWPVAAVTPLLYLGTVIVSWLALTVAGAAGIPVPAFPWFLADAIPNDYLISSSEQAETRALLQTVTGVALLLAAFAVVRDERRTARAVAATLVGSSALLAVATMAQLIGQWVIRGYDWAFLMRYPQGERYSLHLSDLNAAGSLYAMAALCAIGFAIGDRDRRSWWTIGAIAIVPAALLAGSRAAFVAFGLGLLALVAIMSRWRPTRAQLALRAAVVLAIALTAIVWTDWSLDRQGGPGQAVSHRTQFTMTSLRMVAAAPVYGIGLGKYFDRSNEFFTEELRRVYGNENAHNYFLQQMAELGILGGSLFIAMVIPPLFAGWQRIRTDPSHVALAALCAGATTYLITCLTGHPLLVPEAAFPFWIVLGAILGVATPAPEIADPSARAYRWVVPTVAVSLVLAGNVVAAARAYAVTADRPTGFGFHQVEVGEDGIAFRWMTRHAVAYIESGRGFLRLRVKSPEAESGRPFVLETAVAGRVLDRRELPGGEWTTFDVPVREPTTLDFRRVDLRLNQVEWQPVRLGTRETIRPLGVMVAELRWLGLD
jgi:O-antigen ligase